MSVLSRRDLLQGAAVGAVVVGWDPRGGFATAAGRGGRSLDGVPPLDGVLLTDPASRQQAADDFGHVVHRQPLAVLRPGSVEDVVKMVRFARRRRIKIAMRGQGNSSFGQSQVGDGIVIESETLAQIHSIEQRSAVVGPGVLWRTLNTSASVHKVRPPVLTDYQGLTIGGTLSMGGPDSGPSRHGALVDNVLELQVVTGRGELVTCTRTRHRRLFDAVLGGLGQYGVIVRATLKMIPMPEQALTVFLRYHDVHTDIRDMSMLVRARRFDQFEQVVMWEPPGRWAFTFLGAQYFTPPNRPNQDKLLEGLHDDRSQRVVSTMPYPTWVSRFDPLSESILKTVPAKNVPFAGFVPARSAHRFFGDFFAKSTGDDLGQGPVVFLTFDRAKAQRPLLKLPPGISFGIILFRRANDDAHVRRFLAANRQLHDRMIAAGGKRYPFDSIPDVKQRDWIRHYGPRTWDFVEDAKEAFDPANILGTSWNMFPRNPANRP